MTAPVLLLLGTRKGAFLIHGDASRERWRLDGPHFLGHQVHHLVADPRPPSAAGRAPTLLAAARAGHLGPTLFRSTDAGATWTEATTPPAFPRAPDGVNGRSVDHVFWIEPGPRDAAGVWYAGTSPPALFRSDDDGVTWSGVSGFNDHPMWATWTGDGEDGTPDGSLLHSINVDPRDPDHLYVGLSGGGVFETTDGGGDWQPLNAGCEADFLPEPFPEFGQDPHCMVQHPAAPDVLWQQNHCGIYRMCRTERASDRWDRVGRNMPEEVGDIGFPIAVHPRDPDTAWVFPMDGTDVWPRTSPDGRPAVYRTRDAGTSWTRCDSGLPAEQAWLTVFRQAMATDVADPLGIYFGTTTGEVWASRDEGDGWTCIARHLPDVYSLECTTEMP